jgi:tetratricopeptide (TPR) repeat protein
MTSCPVEIKREYTRGNSTPRVLVAFLVPSVFAGLILAQPQSPPENQRNRCALWGVTVSSSRFSAEGMKVELTRDRDPNSQTTQVVHGAFDFPSVSPGIYHFRVIDTSGRVVLWKTESLKGNDDYVIMFLPYSIAEPSLKNLISKDELNHKIPRQARNAFRTALEAEEAGDLPKSIEAFRKALVIDPRLVEAEINLAMQYNRSGQLEQAIAHAQSAFDTRIGDPDAAHALAMLLLSARQYERIERIARFMLAKQQAVSEMHGLLAVSLLGQRRNLDEAFAHLELAAENFPIVRWLIANTLIEIGLPKLAVVQINNYSKSSTNECVREALENWAASLSQSQSTMAAIPEN